MLVNPDCRISIVVPAKDEQDSLRPLVKQIRAALETASLVEEAEIILVDDGSRDATWHVMQKLFEKFPDVLRVVRLRRTFGKATALNAGFHVARGQVIITMDADLQDDPREIPRFLDALESFDLVCGWRRRRLDPTSKTIPSRIFNRVSAWATGIPLHDFNCGYKAYRREVIERIRIHGELYRYIPVFAHDEGFRVGEIEVTHHPRTLGVSKFGFERYLRGFLDLLTVLATTRFMRRPAHLFGGIGVILGLLGVLVLSYLSALWFFGHPIGARPLFFLGILMLICALQMISLGIVSELLIRIARPRNVTDFVAEETSTGESWGTRARQRNDAHEMTQK